MHSWLRAAPLKPPFDAWDFSIGVSLLSILGFCFLGFRWYASGIHYLDAMLAFLCMELLNAFFPHIIASLVLWRYTPGLYTSIALYLPAGTYLYFLVGQGSLPAPRWQLWVLGALVGALGAGVCVAVGAQIRSLLVGI